MFLLTFSTHLLGKADLSGPDQQDSATNVDILVKQQPEFTLLAVMSIKRPTLKKIKKHISSFITFVPIALMFFSGMCGFSPSRIQWRCRTENP